MTTRTASDLATAIMRDLSLIDALEEPAAEDREYIVQRYANILEEMRDDLLVTWEADAIPYDTFEAVVGLMRIVIGPAFGIPGLIGEDMNNALEGAKKRIRRRSMKRSSGLPVQVEYF